MLHARRAVSLLVLTALISLASAALAEPTPLPSAPAAQHYEVQATLLPTQRRVDGELVLTLRNDSAAPLTELVFHLYLNAFRDARSVFMRESGGQLRGARAEGRGGIDLASLRVGGLELLGRAQRELVPGDFTQLSVPLPTPLGSGESTRIEMRFSARLPPLFARSGYVDDFYAVAQWFPKLAKLEPDGHFASFPYHGLGEFYADFADYDFTVRTPQRFLVAACGELVREQKAANDTIERVYRARRVHDVAWFASPDFVRTEERVGSVQVSLFTPPGYDLARLEHVNVVRRGLQLYGERFGSYPYKTLSVVVPPRGAEGAAGMEYPTLIVTEGEWLPTPWTPSLSGAIVTAHELAHQWFYGLLASDEVRYPVLDEGLSEWATLELMRVMYGAIDRSAGAHAPDRFDIERSAIFRHYGSISPGLSAPSYSTSEYATSVYGRASLALESIRRAHGKQRFEAALSRYAHAQRFRHPTPDDLARAFDEVYGAGFAARVLRPLLFEGESCGARLLSVKTRMAGSRHLTDVRARREGKVALPSWVAAYDANGHELTRQRWPLDQELLSLRLTTTQPVSRVIVDPDRALLLDADARDQVWVLRAAQRPPWLLQLIAAAQVLLAWWGP